MKRQDLLILSLIAVILGILLVGQLYLTKEAEKLKKGEENQFLALEISRLLKANTDLRLEIKELGTTLEKYQKSLSDRKSAAEEIIKNLEKYRIISGRTKVEGRGVEITVEGDLSPQQLVDLINALKNIGIEAMSINKNRVVISSFVTLSSDGLYFEDRKLEGPYQIEALGNALLLKESLERKGGIIEQIKNENKEIEIHIEEREKIVLQSHS